MRNLDLRASTSAATLVEARDPKVPQAAFDHAVSLAKVRHVTERTAPNHGSSRNDRHDRWS
ncbi:hypothetical protein [Kitasatospora sp. NPDC056531]|uniref:hypothetical protein n=1 Tax=Kitasatospora sp. NPDC056531 TaxID=3345856 RepID=UPI0036C46999